MKTFCKKFLSILLLILFIFPVIPAAAYTVEDVIDAASVIIHRNEGVYTTVVANDNGALSIGKVGWHATRALNLLKTIVEANPENAETILGEALYSEITTETSWNTRILSSEEKSAVAELLATEESIAAQDELSYKDIETYITHGRSLGFEDGKVLVYFADLENQMGSGGSKRVAMAAIEEVGSSDKVTLDTIFNAAMNDTTASSSPTRRKTVYNYCLSLTLGDKLPDDIYNTGKYRVNVSSSLNIRSGPDSSFDKIGSLYNGTEVTVTQVSGDWGKITYRGVTGWVSLMYVDYIEDNGSSETVGKKGDVNANGKIDASDARLILRFSAGLEKFSQTQQKNADVNGDGKVSAADARKVLRASANLEKL